MAVPRVTKTTFSRFWLMLIPPGCRISIWTVAPATSYFCFRIAHSLHHLKSVKSRTNFTKCPVPTLGISGTPPSSAFSTPFRNTLSPSRLYHVQAVLRTSVAVNRWRSQVGNDFGQTYFLTGCAPDIYSEGQARGPTSKFLAS